MLKSLIPVVLLGAAMCMAAAQQEVIPVTTAPPPHTISVTGSAERMVPPDLAIVTLAIQTQAVSLGDAVQQNNVISARGTEAIKKVNVPNLTLRTLGFDVQPVYEQPAQNHPATYPPKIVGYQTVNRLEVRIPDKDADRLAANVGKAIDAALTMGVNRVDNVQFTLQDMNAAQREVLADATKSAKLTAETMAAAADVRLGSLLSLSAGGGGPVPPPMFARAMQADNAAMGQVPITAGMLTITATVSAVYEVR